MPDAFEELVLSGVLFEQSRPSRPPTPVSRTPTPNTDDELFGSASSRATSPARKSVSVPNGARGPESIGMGPGRTGVKGVIRDRDEARERNRARKEAEMREVQRMMEKSSLSATGKTFLEEEAEKQRVMREEAGEEDIEKARPTRKGKYLELLGGPVAGGGAGAFGHLREVGSAGYVQAVEKEARDVWVVIHIYHPHVDRCIVTDAELSLLARRHFRTKFLRVRASAIGFATSSPILETEQDQDDHLSDEYEGEVDIDMLPTILVYRAGELVFTWVRVDWEAPTGIADLLQKQACLFLR
ncbi:hypothetical protein BS47DRAFT_1297070 [Hydnum rufescens UP504]|uniref:Phosducin thioredoxin-like domain-containing protein n=1 Tax=Hydnum rufescens UP504 TaxID=1448309 RepID=A0A9P6DVQ5_9AGAM|nr:hypothetical protein BS47DRAFT_1297070 [Hydnum rufescens UP504]